MDVIRGSAIDGQRSLTGQNVLPLFVEAEYAVDIDTLADLQKAASVMALGRLHLAVPRERGAAHPLADGVALRSAR